MIKPIIDLVFDHIKNAEEKRSPLSVILPGFHRSIQIDGYSCGAQCAYMILKYYGKARSIKNVKKEAGTNEDGTESEPIKKLFRKRGLTVREFSNGNLSRLERAIDRNSPILAHISTRKEDHWVVVYGYDKDNIWVADPSLNVLKFSKRIWCSQKRSSFRKRWKGFGIVVGKTR